MKKKLITLVGSFTIIAMAVVLSALFTSCEPEETCPSGLTNQGKASSNTECVNKCTFPGGKRLSGGTCCCP
jgi:hypothetical protein